MFDPILVICTGNICRSPLGAAMLAEALPAMRVNSAGVGALSGHPADETVCRIAAEAGLDLSSHRARSVDVAMIRQSGLILCMDTHHLEAIVHIDPTARGKTFLMGHWGEGPIEDPYRHGEAAYRQAHEHIARATASWLPRLA